MPASDALLVEKVVCGTLPGQVKAPIAPVGDLTNWASIARAWLRMPRPTSIVRALVSRARAVSFNRSLIAQTVGAVGQWVEAGKPKPVTASAFANMTLAPLKVAGLVVVTDELLRAADSATARTLADDLGGALDEAIDQQFASDAAGVSNVKPSGILNGATAIPSTGNNAAAIAADVGGMVAALASGVPGISAPVWLMRPQALATMQLTRVAEASGTTLAGWPVLASPNVQANTIGLADAAFIALALEGVVIDTSTQAAVQMRDDPVAGAANLVSLWQHDYQAVRGETFVNWSISDSGAAVKMTGVTYG